jgi:tetratricopeptide (TPR) repeat protein
MSPDERARLRKQMSDQAIKLAVNSRWDEAAGLNRDYLRLFGEESDGLNRLGKALSELGQMTEARKAYGRTLEIEPGNTIARRNLDRLAGLQDAIGSSQPASQLDTRLFIEETGKSTTATLQAVDTGQSALVDAGDLVELRAQGKAVNVHNIAGDYIGMVEPRIGLRLAKMMAAGNRYSAAMVTVADEFKVMLREEFQHPTQIGKVSFPQGRVSPIRAYTRRNLLRGEDMEFPEDDEYVEEEETDEWSDSSGDSDHAHEVDVETDDEGFD